MGRARHGHPGFLLGLTVFAITWMAWNTFAPENLRFDSIPIGFTALTLVLSLQASYAAPLILLAQNRQDDRDRVQIEQDRQRAERNLADTEYLAREVVALRLAMKDIASKDFIRAELRAMLEELDRPARGGAGACRTLTPWHSSTAVRAALASVIDPEIRKPDHRARHGRLGVGGRRRARARRHPADDRRLPRRRPHRARRAPGGRDRRGAGQRRRHPLA